jgi:hypothetical protein
MLAVLVDGSRRSAATASRWTSNRASGKATASTSQVRNRPDRKTHMSASPLFARCYPQHFALIPGRPGDLRHRPPRPGPPARPGLRPGTRAPPGTRRCPGHPALACSPSRPGPPRGHNRTSPVSSGSLRSRVLSLPRAAQLAGRCHFPVLRGPSPQRRAWVVERPTSVQVQPDGPGRPPSAAARSG